MRATLIFTLTQIKRMFRDRLTMFFTILFPLIFLFVFGTIFGGSDNVNFKIALLNQSDSQFASSFVEQINSNQTFTVTEIGSSNEAREKIARGEVDSVIELPADFGQPNQAELPSGEMLVYYDEANPQAGQTLATVMSGILDEINSNMTGAEPPLSVAMKSSDSTGLSQFDYTFSGLLAFTLMSLTIFGLSNQLPSEKKTGALRRIKATPFRPYQVIIGMSLAYLVLTAISVLAMVAVGVLAFHFEMRGSWLVLAGFAALGALVMSGFGMVVAGWAKNPNQSAPLAQVIAFPMMFLSGVFFPRFLMPDWLQNITSWIPLTPIGDGIRFITTEGAVFADLLPQLGLMAAWGLAAYLLAFKVFRWE